MKQTAVEWLEKKLIRLEKTTGVYGIMYELLARAKAMEKDHIVDAHIEGQRVFDNYNHTQWTTDQAEQYYSETFNK